MDTIRNILQLVRWSNLFFLGALIYVMEKWVVVPILDDVAFGEQLPWYILLLIAAATILIAAGGYVINDYFDIKIDRINRPDQLIVTQYISKENAMRLSIGLSGVGMVCGLVAAWLLRSSTIAILFAIIPGLLWFYSSSYKRLLIVGNVTIALLSALSPMMIAIANVAQLQLKYSTILPYTTLEHDIYAWVGGFSLFAFLLTWIREIVKDLQDQMGDRELECHSMPIVWGNIVTKIVVTALIVLTTVLIGWFWYSLLPFDHSWQSFSTRYIVLAIIIPLWGALWLLWAAKIPSDYRTCQQVLKLTMFLGMLYSFVLR
ncbi:MAG: geranylgeranylglycerol-phosphate geranylgeranyltransferase [Paludibacteraceae bacterium]|jgi:4-hydroxybenzoate polyprenyltransferase|nr:geranylgeranylglycerol-phosphate geranylgeranyltransferase [Paludibacteraceae bacterium]